MKPSAGEAKIFGAAMKRWREKRGLTQEGLAGVAGIASSYVSHIERGEHSAHDVIPSFVPGDMRVGLVMGA